MEKALDILKADLHSELYYVALHGICETSRAKMLREAIAELEAMKQRTCNGCKYGRFGIDSFGLEIECLLAYKCSRGQDDRYEPKDNA